MKEMDSGTLRVLNMLKKHAPDMPLWEAYSHIEQFQEMRYELDKAQYIIVTMLEDILGFNGDARLCDKEIAERLKDASDEVWAVLKMSTTIHAGYACSPFTSKNWKSDKHKKFAITKQQISDYKEIQLNNLKE